MIGINDVWRHFAAPPRNDHVAIDRYETTYRSLLEKTRRGLKGLVLMTPYVIEPDLFDPMRARMDAYGLVVERLAGEFDAIFVNVQAAFDSYLTRRPARSLCEDRVHPNQSGHLIIARSFMSAIDF